MNFETLNAENSDVWDALCVSSDDAWFWHSRPWLKYQRSYRPELDSKNLSFLAFDANGEAVALCPLFLERHGETREFSFGGSHLPPPVVASGLSSWRRDEILKAVFEQIDTLAVQQGVTRCSFRISPLTSPALNWLMKYGYLDASLNSQVIQVSRPIEELRKDVRKGHLSDIKRGQQLMELVVFDKTTLTKEIFATYQKLHATAAGRATRPQETFDLMRQMILDGSGILVAARADDRFVGFSLVILCKKAAYYASAANDPNSPYDRYPIAHAIQWKTIEWLNTQGYEAYEIGWQQFSAQLHDHPTEKDLNLSRFKRGFGGVTKPLYIGEKYYDPAFCEKVLNSRARTYTAAVTASSSGQKM